MTVQALQLKATTEVEDQVRELSKEIAAQYELALAQVDERLKDLFARMSGVKPEDRYNWLIQYNRNAKLKEQIQRILEERYKEIYGLQYTSSSLSMINNYYGQFYALSWMDSVDFALIDENLVDYAILGQISAWKNIKDQIGQASDWFPASGTLKELIALEKADALKKIMAQINAGMINGESYTAIVARVAQMLGSGTIDEATGLVANAMRIVATEGHRLQQLGALAAALEAESQGIAIRRKWDATLDSKTREAHGNADGQEVGTDKPFTVGGEELMTPGDPSGSPSNTIRCRCVALTLAGDFQPTARRGRNPITGRNEVIDYVQFNDWAESHGLRRNAHGILV